MRLCQTYRGWVVSSRLTRADMMCSSGFDVCEPGDVARGGSWGGESERAGGRKREEAGKLTERYTERDTN